MKYIGIIEVTATNDSDHHLYTEVIREGDKLRTGSPTNNTFLYDEWEVCISDYTDEQEALEELHQILQNAVDEEATLHAIIDDLERGDHQTTKEKRKMNVTEQQITFEPIGMTRTLQVSEVLVDGKHIGLSERTHTPWMKPWVTVYWPHVQSLSEKEANETMEREGGFAVSEEPYGDGFFVEFDDIYKAIEYCLKHN